MASAGAAAPQFHGCESVEAARFSIRRLQDLAQESASVGEQLLDGHVGEIVCLRLRGLHNRPRIAKTESLRTRRITWRKSANTLIFTNFYWGTGLS